MQVTQGQIPSCWERLFVPDCIAISHFPYESNYYYYYYCYCYYDDDDDSDNDHYHYKLFLLKSSLLLLLLGWVWWVLLLWWWWWWSQIDRTPFIFLRKTHGCLFVAPQMNPLKLWNHNRWDSPKKIEQCFNHPRPIQNSVSGFKQCLAAAWMIGDVRGSTGNPIHGEIMYCVCITDPYVHTWICIKNMDSPTVQQFLADDFSICTADFSVSHVC